MYLKRIFYIYFLLCFCNSCINTNQTYYKKVHVEKDSVKIKKAKLTASEWKNWQHKDYKEDTIAGISLDKAYQKILKKKKLSNTITIAVIDGRVDMSHEDIRNSFWINTNEIANNGIDDDKNGYVDDLHGWNYLGNKNGKQLYRSPYEYIRVLNKYEDRFKGKTQKEIQKSELKEFNIYKRALKAFDDRMLITDDNFFYLDSLISTEIKLKEKLVKIFPNQTINEEFIDSIIKLDNSLKSDFLGYKYLYKNKDWAINRRKAEENYLKIYLNKEFKDREFIGDKENEISFTDYGNPNVDIDTTKNRHSHAIQVTSIIVADRSNNLGIYGITDKVKIMSLAVAPYGESHDKDIALAIRYAVDNGAKVINMSIGKSFSLYENWVNEAIKYAEKHDVLIVTSAGNNNLDLDTNLNYPNDAVNHKNEFVSNFIKVGGSTFKVSENLVYSSSNYGKNEVDIFAPAEYIYTARNDNKYDYSSGTSCASAIVSGVATLIRSHYPNLTATEVKQIIMKSGVSYDIMVNKPSENEEKELIPFSSLSKSGKIVNAYNALLMAEEVSKKKKGN